VYLQICVFHCVYFRVKHFRVVWNLWNLFLGNELCLITFHDKFMTNFIYYICLLSCKLILTYFLFNYSGCIVSNYVNKTLSWPIFIYYHDICLTGLRKTSETWARIVGHQTDISTWNVLDTKQGAALSSTTFDGTAWITLVTFSTSVQVTWEQFQVDFDLGCPNYAFR
jgi:hypothetical protein